VPGSPIIIKKVSGHGGHHGGAWKVAYADFVTALMALFIVLWLLSSSKQVQEAVGGYFKDPSGTSKKVGSSMQGSGQSISLRKDDMAKIKDALARPIMSLPDFEKLKKNVEMTITSEGLRIELMEDEEGTFFESGSALPSASGKLLLIALAQELGKLPNHISIEGHTDSKPYSGGLTGYSNWELSVARANAARTIMQSYGLQEKQLSEVRGYADRRPRVNQSPDEASNRRISVIVEYLGRTPEEGTGSEQTNATGKSAEEKSGARGGH